MDLAGFLFGNVNEEGELEDEEILDKVSCNFTVKPPCSVGFIAGLCGWSEPPWCGPGEPPGR